MRATIRTGASDGRKRTVVLLAAVAAALVALMAAAIAPVGSTAQAQTAQGVDLDVKKSVSPKVVSVGERQTFTIKVANEGNRRARNVSMSDPLPAKVKFVRASTSRHVPGSCGLEPGRTVVCDLGTLRPAKTVTVRIYVRTVEAGGYTNRAFVSFGGTGALEPGASAARDAATSRVLERR